MREFDWLGVTGVEALGMGRGQSPISWHELVKP
jgi:hypothetical protein